MFKMSIKPSPEPPVVRVEYKNSRLVDLIDLALSLKAFGESYNDFVHDEGWDVAPDCVRLHVVKLETGSIIGDLAPFADQANWVLDEAKTLAPFVKTFGSIMSYFLGKTSEKTPTRRQAEQIHAFIDPIAKDGGSQLNVGVINGAVTVHHHHYSSQEANAVQNAARRLLGPALPATQTLRDQVLTLHQVRGDESLKTGDRGIIESVSPRHLKLNFSSAEAKKAILDASGNPFHMAFLVDVEVKALDGKPALYRILEVKDAFDRPE